MTNIWRAEISLPKRDRSSVIHVTHSLTNEKEWWDMHEDEWCLFANECVMEKKKKRNVGVVGK